MKSSQQLRFIKTIALPILSAALLFVAFPAFGQIQRPQTPEERAALQRQLEQVEREIAEQQTILEAKQRETTSLQRDLDILNANIKKSQLVIRAQELAIANISTDINTKEKTIGELTTKMSRERASVAEILRQKNQLDGYSMVEMFLGKQSIGEFFSELDSYSAVGAALNKSFTEIAALKEQTHLVKNSLVDKRTDEEKMKSLKLLEQNKIKQQESQKKSLLTTSKGQEAEYQKILKQKQQTASEIRAALFELQGSAAIPFGKAYDIAKAVGARAGVRPALILGIIRTESDLGKNVGTGNWKADMNPKEHETFLSFTKRLGLNPDTVPVSARPCSKAERDRIGPGVACGYGWGGAMGPAQFIPTTWALYETKVANLTGHNPPNPWDPYDAFAASALLLSENGANKGTRAAERLAALRYLAGWKNAEKPAYAFYGDSVMGFADQYQAQINVLEGKAQ